MKLAECNREEEVIRAVRSGRWTGPWGEETRRHAAECPVCSEVALVAEMMQRDLESSAGEMRLPSPGLMWWKAQLAARRAAAERAARPIDFFERIALGVGAAALIVLALVRWPSVAAWFASFGGAARAPQAAVHAVASASAWAVPGYLLVVTVAAFLTLMAAAVYAMLRED